MMILHGHVAAPDSVDNVAARWRVLHRVSAVLSGLAVVAVVAAPQLILSANSQGGGQATTHTSKSAGAPAGNAENGKQLFKNYGCYECHGSQGQITSRSGPALTPDLVPFDGFAPYVHHPTGSMPPYTEKVVSDQDLADIYAFLQLTPRPPPVKTIPILN